MGDRLALARLLVERHRERSASIAVAESLTGGALASAIVDVPGASVVFRGGAVTYATETKVSVLGVSEERLALTGPVDGVVAEQMAAGAARLFRAEFGIATTGVAGPGPNDGFPAGTVWIGVWPSCRFNFNLSPTLANGKILVKNESGSGIEAISAVRMQLTGSRSEIRDQAVRSALGIAIACVECTPE
ncbi:CinA family protein [Arcanobacterium wilhelmae]|uniref:CinA family protein n=1 Tax=Arcanobacterium wilhelmae TaxID=1803177 RepID=UPI0024155371|nr:CinA family protein [Arcanobacterium wilhelmae]WFN91151.1 CinA family protein [Arcanobacterium wilhelmae]